MSNRRFNTRFWQYVIEYEGDLEEELNSAFNTLLSEIDLDYGNIPSNIPDLGTLETFTTNVFTTSIRTLTIIELVNRAFSHRITQAILALELTTKTIKAFLLSYYTSKVFHGIIINTGASIYSTTGRGQFKAL